MRIMYLLTRWFWDYFGPFMDLRTIWKHLRDFNQLRLFRSILYQIGQFENKIPSYRRKITCSRSQIVHSCQNKKHVHVACVFARKTWKMTWKLPVQKSRVNSVMLPPLPRVSSAEISQRADDVTLPSSLGGKMKGGRTIKTMPAINIVANEIFHSLIFVLK